MAGLFICCTATIARAGLLCAHVAALRVASGPSELRSAGTCSSMSTGASWRFPALELGSSGVLPDALERLAVEQRIMTPSMVVRREVYERLGGFDDRLPCSEDWEMWVRIAAHYPVGFEPEPLAAYRMHPNSNTGRNTHNADNMRYTRAAIDMFKEYLPAGSAHDIALRARETYALCRRSSLRASDYASGTCLAPSRRHVRRCGSGFLREYWRRSCGPLPGVKHCRHRTRESGSH